MLKNDKNAFDNQAKQWSPVCAPLGDEINVQISLKNINMDKND